MRLCVEVDLSKSLLNMFTIRDRVYNMEYKGLNLLYFKCWKFGQCMEGCGEEETHLTKEGYGV